MRSAGEEGESQPSKKQATRRGTGHGTKGTTRPDAKAQKSTARGRRKRATDLAPVHEDGEDADQNEKGPKRRRVAAGTQKPSSKTGGNGGPRGTPHWLESPGTCSEGPDERLPNARAGTCTADGGGADAGTCTADGGGQDLHADTRTAEWGKTNRTEEASARAANSFRQSRRATAYPKDHEIPQGRQPRSNSRHQTHTEAEMTGSLLGIQGPVTDGAETGRWAATAGPAEVTRNVSVGGPLGTQTEGQHTAVQVPAVSLLDIILAGGPLETPSYNIRIENHAFDHTGSPYERAVPCREGAVPPPLPMLQDPAMDASGDGVLVPMVGETAHVESLTAGVEGASHPHSLSGLGLIEGLAGPYGDKQGPAGTNGTGSPASGDLSQIAPAAGLRDLRSKQSVEQVAGAPVPGEAGRWGGGSGTAGTHGSANGGAAQVALLEADAEAVQLTHVPEAAADQSFKRDNESESGQDGVQSCRQSQVMQGNRGLGYEGGVTGLAQEGPVPGVPRDAVEPAPKPKLSLRERMRLLGVQAGLKP